MNVMAKLKLVNFKFLAGGILLVLAVSWFFTGGEETVVEETATQLPEVLLTTANAEIETALTSLIGTVRPLSEAEVTTELSGRVTSVPVRLGQTVGAGAVIATLENASERAAVLQAEGVYEAALASAEQSGVSVTEAENALVNSKRNAITAYKNAYTTVNGIVLNNIDQFFSTPNSQVPGLRLNGKGQTSYLNDSRVMLNVTLEEWRETSGQITVEQDLSELLSEAEAEVGFMLEYVDVFIDLFNNQGNDSRYSDAELQIFSTTFNGLRSSLVATISNLESADNAITNAEESLRKARIGSGNTNSVSDAQVKQALGSLRAAEANLAKTVLTTPISGTINTLSVRTGEFVGGNQTVAVVANNNALEIVTFVSEREKDFFSVGTSVTVEGRAEGEVVAVAPAIDQTTNKREIRIVTEDSSLSSGDTVRIALKDAPTPAVSEDEPLRVPLTAVKFESTNGHLLRVNEGVLERIDVVVGEVRGSTVVIEEGIDSNTDFIIDARGRNAGDEVVVVE